jgi:acyl-CoA thioester hydrolase
MSGQYHALVSEPFGMQIAVAEADIDEVGHVSNLVYVRWVLDVAMAHSRAKGYDWGDYRRIGLVFLVRRHEIDYVASVQRGDTVTARTWVSDWKLASCTRRTEILRGETVCARATTTWAMVSIASGRPTRIPDELRAQFV